MIFLFVVSRMSNAGGDSITIDCPICFETISIRPADSGRPFVLLHGELKHLHGLCLRCADEQYTLYSVRMCPLCGVAIDESVLSALRRFDPEQWHEFNVACLTQMRLQEWEEIRGQKKAEQANQRADGDGRCMQQESCSHHMKQHMERGARRNHNRAIASQHSFRFKTLFVGVICAVIIGIIVWRADCVDDDNACSNKKQSSFVARLRSRLSKL